MFAKNDAYVELSFNNELVFTTSVKEEAGLQAEWDEHYDFDHDVVLSKGYQHHAVFKMIAFDKDTIGSDFLGQSNSIAAYWLLKNLSDHDNQTKVTMNLYGENKHKAVGSIVYSASRITKDGDGNTQPYVELHEEA